MKKVLGLCLLCVSFLLVGCGKTTPAKSQEQKVEETVEKSTSGNSLLVCSKYSAGSVNFTTEMSYHYENDKAVKLGIRYNYDLSSYTEEQRKAFANAGMCETDAIKETLAMIDCKEELSGTDYIVEGYSEKLLGQSSGSLSLVKQTLESQGWTCYVK